MSRSAFGLRLGSRRLLALVFVGCGRRHPGCRDLVATGWSSPSCSEGDAPMVVFWLPDFWRWFVPWLADDPPGGLREVCRAYLCRLTCLGYKLAVSFAYGGCPTSPLSPSAWHLRACPVQRLSPFSWDPHPWEPVEGILRAMSMLELAAMLADSRAEGKMVVGSGIDHVMVSGVGPQLGRAAVVRVWCVLYSGSLASLYREGYRQESAAGELEVNLVALAYTMVRVLSGCLGSLTSWRVRGPGQFCLWALDLVERVRAEGCFRMFSDSTGFAGVVFAPTLVVGHGVLYSTAL
ncbi:hypothetical protein Taro_055440 [Colocasia esculenta]|uniref:Uncharacterized protein n=1 Tax=Colocasia esculenta TaxID=4460 RepID=A0A843XR00_COLES|nr:hypothetical protein [Colocasia esculenta]